MSGRAACGLRRHGARSAFDCTIAAVAMKQDTDPRLRADVRRRRLLRALAVFGAGGLAACGGGGEGGDSSAPVDGGPRADPADSVSFSPLAGTPQWTPDTHGKLKTAAIRANLSKVFDGAALQRLDIAIEHGNWQLMQSDLAALHADLRKTKSMYLLDDPVTVPCALFHGGREWYKVGIRFKGNSSLYAANSGKLPLKLKFNEFEAQYPAIAGQRFHGFKALHLKSNFRDASLLRELLADDLLRAWGMACPHAGLYQVWLDVGDGNGPGYHGVYTVVEDVEDTVLKTQLGNDDGNLYKPEDSAASFAAGSWNAAQMRLKNNKDGAAYRDVLALYTAINDSAAFDANRGAWKAALEAAFDVPRFLRWLAANTVMQNWDSYGNMPQNYYLYADPANAGRLAWLLWDHNEAMASHKRALDLSMSGVTSAWPLLHYITRDAAYFAMYKAHVAEFADRHYRSPALDNVIDTHASLVRAAALSERAGYTYTSASRFDSAVIALKAQVAARHAAALAFAA